MRMARSWLAAVLIAVLGSTVTAWAQTPAPAAEAKKEEEKPKTFWEENKLFAYIENSFTSNLSGAGRGAYQRAPLLRLPRGLHVQHGGVQHQEGPVGEVPVRVRPRARPPASTSQKNHSFGIFRDETTRFRSGNTEKFDLQEAYVSGLVPVGSGLTLKAGKFVTLLGYEVIESPNNLNFSRGYLFRLAIPLTHTGGLASYTFTDWFNMTAGVVLGWDDSKNVNDSVSYTGQFAFTPLKDFTANLNWIVGPEQRHRDPRRARLRIVTRDAPDLREQSLRYVLDFVCRLHRVQEPDARAERRLRPRAERSRSSHPSLGTRQDTDATWWGWAGTRPMTGRTACAPRSGQEFFRDAAGAGPAPASGRISGRRPRRCSTRSGRGWWAGSSTGTTSRTRTCSGCATRGRTSPRRAARARQEHGHHLGQPLLLVLLAVLRSGPRLLRR